MEVKQCTLSTHHTLFPIRCSYYVFNQYCLSVVIGEQVERVSRRETTFWRGRCGLTLRDESLTDVQQHTEAGCVFCLSVTYCAVTHTHKHTHTHTSDNKYARSHCTLPSHLIPNHKFHKMVVGCVSAVVTSCV